MLYFVVHSWSANSLDHSGFCLIQGVYSQTENPSFQLISYAAISPDWDNSSTSIVIRSHRAFQGAHLVTPLEVVSLHLLVLLGKSRNMLHTTCIEPMSHSSMAFTFWGYSHNKIFIYIGETPTPRVSIRSLLKLNMGDAEGWIRNLRGKQSSIASPFGLCM